MNLISDAMDQREAFGRHSERDRIVAIINLQREWHVNSPYNHPESVGRVQVAIGYAIEVLDSILVEIQNG